MCRHLRSEAWEKGCGTGHLRKVGTGCSCGCSFWQCHVCVKCDFRVLHRSMPSFPCACSSGITYQLAQFTLGLDHTSACGGLGAASSSAGLLTGLGQSLQGDAGGGGGGAGGSGQGSEGASPGPAGAQGRPRRGAVRRKVAEYAAGSWREGGCWAGGEAAGSAGRGGRGFNVNHTKQQAKVGSESRRGSCMAVCV